MYKIKWYSLAVYKSSLWQQFNFLIHLNALAHSQFISISFTEYIYIKPQQEETPYLTQQYILCVKS